MSGNLVNHGCVELGNVPSGNHEDDGAANRLEDVLVLARLIRNPVHQCVVGQKLTDF